MPPPHRLVRLADRVLPPRTLELARATLERLLAVQFVDRAVALGSLAFTALVPLLLIVAAYAPGASGLADGLIRRFRLTGASADLVREVFAQPDDVRQAVSWLGVALLLASALSFTRALQRLYEQCWRLGSRGMRGTPAGLQWLVGIVLWATAFAAVRRWVVDATGDAGAVAVALAGGCLLWLWSPYVLLARRVAWRRLLPTALLTATAMTALSVGSVLYMPDAIATSAERYGPIGIAIAIVSWLVGTGFVLAVCAALGAVLGGAQPDGGVN